MLFSFDQPDSTAPIESFGYQVRLAMDTSIGTGKLQRSRAMRKQWILASLVLALAIMVAAKYGVQLVRRFQNDREPAHQQIAGPAALQPFDERLSLRMPVAFGSPTEFPLERLPVEARGNVQKMVQRTANFSGVYIVAMKVTNAPGTKGNLEDSLHNTFSRNVNPPAPNMPEISWSYVNGVRQSGAVRFPAVFGNTKGEMTAVVIKSETEDSFWCVNAWGTGKAADLAEKTAREFAFK
jgi:hypothetical protein